MSEGAALVVNSLTSKLIEPTDVNERGNDRISVDDCNSAYIIKQKVQLNPLLGQRNSNAKKNLSNWMHFYKAKTKQPILLRLNKP